MCSLKRRPNTHKTDRCRTSNHKLFKNSLDSIVDYTPKERKALWLKSKALINGSQLTAVDYRKHIETIANDNYIKINKIPEFPSAEKLLKHVSLAHKVREKIEENDSRFPKKHVVQTN